MSSNGTCLSPIPRKKRRPKRGRPQPAGVTGSIQDTARALWKKFRLWGIIGLVVLCLPVIEPVVATLLVHVPAVRRVVAVQYPEELTIMLGRIPAFFSRDLLPAAAARSRMIMAGTISEKALCAASAAAFCYFLAFHLIPAFIIVWRRQRDRLSWASLLIGVVVWLQVIVSAVASHLGARKEVAGALLPSYAGVENGATWCRELIEQWFGIEVTYFGFNPHFLDFLRDLELHLFFIACGFALFLCWFSALSIFDYTWARVRTPLAEDTAEGDADDDE